MTGDGAVTSLHPLRAAWRRLARCRPAWPARRTRDRLALLLALALGLGALVFLLHGVDLVAVRDAMLRQPPAQLLWALALTGASFACLALHDAVSVAVVAGRRAPLRVALLAGACGGAIANTLGFHALSGSAVRAHLYVAAGLSGAQVARVLSLSGLALVVGNATMLAAAELVQAGLAGHRLAHLGMGGALAVAQLALLVWLGRAPRRIAIRRFSLPLPSARLALAQMAIGAVESGAAVGALYVLLPADLAPPFSLFAVGCIAAVALGVAAHTPGGIGVFEAGITALLAGRGRSDLLAALLLYRLVFNLLPFALALAALAWRAARRRRARAP